MRYFQKLLCLLILVLAASFGVGGCVLLYSDFSVQRSRMAAANAAAHAQACTLLQTEILDLQRRGISTEDAALTARVTAQGVPAALWRGDTLVCATLEGLQSFPLGDAATVTVRTENSIYAVYASDLQGGLRLVTAYDLTGLYRDRNAALMRFLLLEAAVLAAASAVTALLARRLTRPLAVLTDAGAQIAAGDYARRTDLHTGDEIEALSRSFDKMADAVQEKIADLEADVQRREDFVGAFTHELKTPMTSIIGYADMLHTMQTDPDEQREAAAAIVHEGRRLEALSRKLLALLGLNEEGVELTAVPLPALWPRLHAACPDVTLRTPAAAPTVRGDADLLYFDTADGTEKTLLETIPFDTYGIDVCEPFSPAFAGVPQRYLRVLNVGDAYADCLLDMETGDILPAPAVTAEGVRRPALLLACTASGQWLTTASPRDGYDPQYSLYALWDPADFLADGQPATWVTMYATE